MTHTPILTPAPKSIDDTTPTMSSPPLLPAYSNPNKPVSKPLLLSFIVAIVALLSLATAFLLAAPPPPTTCVSMYVFLEDLSPWVHIPSSWVLRQRHLLALQPPPATVSASVVVDKMNEGLGSGRVANGRRLRVYLKGSLPRRLRYSGSAPIIGIVEEGYSVVHNRSSGVDCAWSFVNVEVFNLVTEALGINGSPTDGSDSFAGPVFLPSG